MKILLIVMLLAGCAATQSVEGQAMQTVPNVDINRYAGLWYEIAKIPNSFQKKCASGTTAEYKLLENGRVQVSNTCQKSDGEIISAQGVARIVDAETNAKLQVSFVRFFCRNWFWGDYWIIGLNENYQWAIVGHPKRKYGWILARTPELSPDDLEKCHNILREQGYNPDDFVATEQ